MGSKLGVRNWTVITRDQWSEEWWYICNGGQGLRRAVAPRRRTRTKCMLSRNTTVSEISTFHIALANNGIPLLNYLYFAKFSFSFTNIPFVLWLIFDLSSVVNDLDVLLWSSFTGQILRHRYFCSIDSFLDLFSIISSRCFLYLFRWFHIFKILIGFFKSRDFVFIFSWKLRPDFATLSGPIRLIYLRKINLKRLFEFPVENDINANVVGNLWSTLKKLHFLLQWNL